MKLPSLLLQTPSPTDPPDLNKMSGPTSFGESLDTVLQSTVDMYRNALDFLPNLALAVIILLITALVSKFAKSLFAKVSGRLKLKQSLEDLFLTMVRLVIWFIGFMLVAGILFPDFGFSQILATAGLASIAIGFAFKDIFENFFAGILILWNYPFEVGDFIEIVDSDVEGKVEDIQIRISLIRKTDGQLLIVPNAHLYNNAVRVVTSRKKRRVTLVCGVAYDEDVDESRAVIAKALEACGTVSKDDPIQVYATEFGDSSINFDLRWWTGSTPGDVFKSRDEVVSAVKKALDDAGIEIPYPYRTLTFKENSPVPMPGRTDS